LAFAAAGDRDAYTGRWKNVVHFVVLVNLLRALIAACELAFGLDRSEKASRWRETRFGNRSDVGQ
jgi:hypothetical protein